MSDSPRINRAPDGQSLNVPASERRMTVGDELFSGVGRICDTAVRLTGVDGAAAAVLSGSGGIRELVYASDALAQQIDEMQFTLGEGPCLDAYRNDGPELCAYLDTATFFRRWPAFTAELGVLGVGAVFAYPIPGPLHPMGTLELYRRNGGALAEREQETTRRCAAALQRTLESNWWSQVGSSAEQSLLEQVAIDLEADSAADPLSRTHVHVAAGMVAVQLSISISDALGRLRAHAYAHQQSVVAVAAEVMTRRLAFSDLDDQSRE